MPPKKKIRIPEGQQTLFQVIRQSSNPSENRNDRDESETQESPADLSQREEQDSESETSEAASTKSKVPSENDL